MSKAKRGRPPAKPEERREVFALRLSAVERATIERAADAVGMKVSDWMRTVLLAYANTQTA